MLWDDLLSEVHQGSEQGLQVALFPTLRFQDPAKDWWGSAARDADWWDAWFAQYTHYAVHFADLTTQSGASALVLGGGDVSPALPDGVLPSGEPSGAPADAAQRWSGLIQIVRTHFSGAVYWAMDYPAGAAPPPEFLKSVDQIYLLWSINSLDVTSSSLEGLEGDFDQAFDSVLQPLHEKTGKPILLGADFPLEPGQQVTAYNAILATLNSRPWVDGLISRGFYPPVTLLDSSASVYGKPAADVLWYWYPKLLSPAP